MKLARFVPKSVLPCCAEGNTFPVGSGRYTSVTWKKRNAIAESTARMRSAEYHLGVVHENDRTKWLERMMHPELTRASETDFPFIKNLVPYYIYDMSEYMDWDCNPEGRYDGCDELPEYWEKSEHHPYLIRMDGKTAGFAMIRPYPMEPERIEVGEFFILRKYKRRGIGKRNAFQLFNTYSGKWLVRVLDQNTGARLFWDRIITEYTKGIFEQTPEVYECPHSGTWPMQFYRFESQSRQQPDLLAWR
ncbi:MAG: GNAT family N-acetyltransferase [Gemmatimonadetes bacterium]|nr:GNAT family N-acetyltransferase [Gemmatimonadota bacterium]